MPQWEPALRQISWRAQTRLHDRLRRIGARRGYNAAYTAVGRELCGYVWEVAVWVRIVLAAEGRAHQPSEEVPMAQ